MTPTTTFRAWLDSIAFGLLAAMTAAGALFACWPLPASAGGVEQTVSEPPPLPAELGFLEHLERDWVAFLLASFACAAAGISFSWVVKRNFLPLDWPRWSRRLALYASAFVASLVAGGLGGSFAPEFLTSVLSPSDFAASGVFGAGAGLFFREGIASILRRLKRRAGDALDRIAPDPGPEPTMPPPKRPSK